MLLKAAVQKVTNNSLALIWNEQPSLDPDHRIPDFTANKLRGASQALEREYARAPAESEIFSILPARIGEISRFDGGHGLAHRLLAST